MLKLSIGLRLSPMFTAQTPLFWIDAPKTLMEPSPSERQEPVGGAKVGGGRRSLGDRCRVALNRTVGRDWYRQMSPSTRSREGGTARGILWWILLHPPSILAASGDPLSIPTLSCGHLGRALRIVG